ncbi:ABC transporter substrate-binding protein [Aureimonas jatrophae]|uniref:Putative thiamine transport system substrate-binding protein n=1 Tax=Aureimonas jatrophae TaxID=1166073 RepID=A0A1H0IQD2_9HYPH|nr:ABC transporter substrate-binding protein [Aureimonas jatrophae]MBB3952306.1 putative thiamine transport system substrate-binding protein [Aureimonas jatrophae]SDO33689.1 putative thiamine transport system substrate-binding protein [Aureimonas jatrophae]
MPLLRTVPIALALLSTLIGGTAEAEGWSAVEQAARGERVEMDFVGGEAARNYFNWAAGEIERLYGVVLVARPVTSLDEAARRVEDAGAEGPDLVSTGGGSFHRLLDGNRLAPPFARRLPNWRLVDTARQPAALMDATRLTDGREVPTGATRLVFLADTARDPAPAGGLPSSLEALQLQAQVRPGSMPFPSPDDPAGLLFLQQVLFMTAPEPSILWRPAGESDVAATTAALWAWLDTLHATSWREGTEQPDGPAQIGLLREGAIAVAIATDPGTAAGVIARGTLPASVASFALEGGTIGGANYLAIPAASDTKDGAMVVANFLLSPEAQVRKADPAIWGEPTILAPERLAPAFRERLAAFGEAAGQPDGPGMNLVIQPLHPSWTAPLRAEWQRRYGG